MALLDEIVVCEGNRAAFERVIGILGEQNEQTLMFVHGPQKTGKSMLLQARGRERDLLAKRHGVYAHAAEIIAAIKVGVNEKFLDEIGEVDVLLLDGFDAFFEDEEMGTEVCRLLLAERNRRGLDTVVAARNPLSAYDLSAFGNVFEHYEDVAVEPLDAAGRIEFARRIRDKHRVDAKDAPELSDEVLDFVANEFVKEVDEIRLAVRFLVTQAGFEPGQKITREVAKEALNA